MDNLRLLIILAFTVFFLIFFLVANQNMVGTPFNEFDEAHRAENAKMMWQYKSFLVPLTGSPHDRSGELRVPYRENPQLFLYYHLERPAFIYDLMILSTLIFGQIEWSYRLPSFIFGMLTIFIFIFFIRRSFKKKEFIAPLTGLLALITSTDLWLSSQYAQLDTGLTFFLFLAYILLLEFYQDMRIRWLFFSGISFGLAVLSKGQPAIIFLFPLLYLFLSKKLKIYDLLKIALSAGAVILPWVIYVSTKFGLLSFIKIFSSFAVSSYAIPYIHNQAPLYWYLRWWTDSFRPGLVLFLSLFLVDLLRRRLNFEKKLALFYIIPSFIIVSLPVNKLWWYVLPLVPLISYYIYLSIRDYLKQRENNLLNLSFVIVLASLPLFLQSRTIIALTFLFILVAFSWLILSKLNLKAIPGGLQKLIFVLSVVFSLGLFYLHIPKITPYDAGIKPVAQQFSKFAEPKCLYILDLPSESVLFYSNAGEVKLLTLETGLVPECQNYLMTPRDVNGQKVIYENHNIKLYKLEGRFIR